MNTFTNLVKGGAYAFIVFLFILGVGALNFGDYTLQHRLWAVNICPTGLIVIMTVSLFIQNPRGLKKWIFLLMSVAFTILEFALKISANGGFR